MSLHPKLVPVQYLEYDINLFLMIFPRMLTAVKRRSMRNALVPGRRPRNFPRQNLTETIAEPVLREKKLNDSD